MSTLTEDAADIQKIELYRPSNGTEGDFFMSQFCAKCERERCWRNEEHSPCDISLRTMAFDVTDPEYPREWTFEKDGTPICTAFQEELTPEERAAIPPARCKHTVDMFSEAQ